MTYVVQCTYVRLSIYLASVVHAARYKSDQKSNLVKIANFRSGKFQQWILQTPLPISRYLPALKGRVQKDQKNISNLNQPLKSM